MSQPYDLKTAEYISILEARIAELKALNDDQAERISELKDELRTPQASEAQRWREAIDEYDRDEHSDEAVDIDAIERRVKERQGG